MPGTFRMPHCACSKKTTGASTGWPTVCNRRVHWMAYSLIAGGYMLAGFFAYLDKDTLAIAMLCSTLAGTIASFFQQKSVESRNKDRH